MLRKIFLLFVAVSLAAPAVAGETHSKPRKLAYTVARVDGDGPPKFRIELAFDGDASGTTALELPSRWASETDLQNAVTRLEVLTPGAKLADTDDPARKTIAHKPGQKIRVRYELGEDVERTLEPGPGAGYRVVSRETYTHWIGHAAWAHPAWGDDADVAVSIDWSALPKDWAVANSFGANARKQSFETTMDGFLHALYLTGDFRISRAVVHDRPVYVAMRASWSFTDAEFVALVEKIIDMERTFWSDFDTRYYLISLVQLDADPGAKSVGGTALTDSFATFVTANATLDDFRYLLAHELFHSWNTLGLGRMPEPEAGFYWFSEGFTDYYTYVLLARAGLYSPDEYAGRYNQVLREYYASPARNATNDRVIKEFFSNYDVQKLPYWRGALLAMKWDSEIRAASGGKHSLDDVMHDMLAEARKRNNDRQLDEQVVDEHIRRYLGRSILPDVARFVVSGETIEPAATALGPCFEQTSEEVRSFELGFDLQTMLSSRTIAKVDPRSAAYEAGLRDGQTVVGRVSIALNDPTKQVALTVRDAEGAEPHTITYLPVSRDAIRVPQYRRTAAAVGACLP